jgi:hypothetical protein
MKRYEGLLGIFSWMVFEVNPSLVRMTYHGKPSQHSFKAAFTMLGALMIELLQPLREGVFTVISWANTVKSCITRSTFEWTT